ncbi:TolC family protein [Emticicia sp. ODNR4P]|nr:TolC family protein [Emticicia sp. ODNR4P]
MRKAFYILLICLIVKHTQAQEVLPLSQCYTLAKQNYPIAKQKGYINESLEQQIAQLKSNFKPQVDLVGQATYQSDVTSVPIKIPNIDIPQISKDQYKIYAEVKQSLYDGGITQAQISVQKAASQTEQQKLTVELDKLKERVSQSYFSILLSQNQLKLIDIIKNELQSKINRIKAGIQNGVSTQANLNQLEVEILKLEQRTSEVKSQESLGKKILGLLINQDLSSVQLVSPELSTSQDTKIQRSELTLFQEQHNLLSTQEQLINAKNMPKIGLFLQTGYGRPALNMLENDFKGYYIGGLRFNWSLGGLYTKKQEKTQLLISSKNVDAQQEAFLLNTNIALQQLDAEVKKLDNMIELDQKIIVLREKITKTSSAQLDNGIITASDYVADLSAELQAKENQLIHTLQQALAKANYQSTLGL